ncbi:MAG: vWA domain-containing protein [Planctomycetota bacterium]
MSTIPESSRWWGRSKGEERTPFDADVPAWAVSLVIHSLLLLSMALIGMPREVSIRRPIAIVSPPAIDDVDVEPDLTVDPTEESGFGTAERRDVDVSDAVAPMLAEDPVVPVDVDDAVDPQFMAVEVDEPPSAAELGTFLEAGAVGPGDSGVGIARVSGAVDRLTAEIANSLQQRSTLVCWVFDQSVSLAGQRKEIAARMQRVFDELRTADAVPPGRRLTNLVFAYGQRVGSVLDEPTTETSRVVRAIDSIPVDESGVEMTFSAINEAARTAKRFRGTAARNNVMIVCFTDEVGDDQHQADAVARFCREQAMRVYVFGVPAPFGQAEVHIMFREFDANFADEVRPALVRQGPETLYPEAVRIRSGTEADEPLDSGFGPFSLSKLCAETGGAYFCIHANRDARGRVGDHQVAAMSSMLRYFFDPQVMRAYRPDYRSAAKIDKLLASNRAMQALVKAARASEIAAMDSPTMQFPRVNDGELTALLAEAQKKAAVLQPKIDALHAILTAGLPDREAITEKRWQVGYDLALGRVLALKVRTDAYNILLAQAKSGRPFTDPNSDTWLLVPDRDIGAVGSQTEKLAKQARELLTRVVEEHPGTPWAHLAAIELRVPLGYRWEETRTGVNTPPGPRPGGGGGGPPRDDMRRSLTPPKPKRPLQNI